jgi:type III restriction enzyme
MEYDYFDYSHFLRQASRAIVTRGGAPILTAKQSQIMGIIDDFVSTRCFGRAIDFSKPENYNILNYTLLYDHVVMAIHTAIVRLIEDYKFETKGIWAKLSEVPRIMVRLSKSLATDKSIYPRLGYQAVGGGFERDFMDEVLNSSAEVLSFAKLDRRHRLKISYRDSTAILRNYEVDFIIKTRLKNFLLETKAEKDIDSANVAVKARAAIAWCEQASIVQPPENSNQPSEWEYLILSDNTFHRNRGLGFEAILPFCRNTRDAIIAKAQGKLFA